MTARRDIGMRDFAELRYRRNNSANQGDTAKVQPMLHGGVLLMG
jgi:hypothetical protein